MLLRVIRFKAIKDATIGRFVLISPKGSGVADKEVVLFSGYTLEPAGPDEINSGLDRRIPQGEYQTRWHQSPKFKRRLPLLFNELVDQSRYILIHAGNFGRDTEGCVVVGLRYDDYGVYNSQEALNKLVSLIGKEELRVEIYNGNDI